MLRVRVRGQAHSRARIRIRVRARVREAETLLVIEQHVSRLQVARPLAAPRGHHHLKEPLVLGPRARVEARLQQDALLARAERRHRLSEHGK